MTDGATIKDSFNVAPTSEATRKRDVEMGRLRSQIRNERTRAKTARRQALEADASRAEAEAARARVEARHTQLRAKHLRAVADHQHALDAATDRAERAETVAAAAWAFAKQLRSYCSPHGVAADYADRLEECLRAADQTTPDAPEGGED